MEDFLFYLGLGWDHIITPDALDHLLFITALCAIYLLTDWKQVLILVTAFTIGHSLTLTLSVLDMVRFNGKYIEFLIPCTIVFTAISNLYQENFNLRSIRINYFLALFFGLIHGMGFANTIRFMLASDQHIGMPLFGFNIGLEMGQVVVVIVLLILSFFFVNRFGVARRSWVIFLSAAVFSLALKMVVERIPH